MDCAQGPGRVAEAIRAAATEAGFVDAPADEPADRSVVVVGDDSSGWVSVYDEATENQDETLLTSLGRTLSSALAVPCVGVLVHDSDVLYMSLYEKGRRRDAYINNPDFFGRVPEKERRAVQGHPKRWRHVLRPDQDAGALDAAWRRKAAFAEDILPEVAALLGCPAERVQIGYHYLGELPEGGERIVLRFCRASRPAWEAQGPPVLLNEFPRRDNRFAVRDELSVLERCRNVGGASRGLRVAVWGDAIDQGLVVVETLELLTKGTRRFHSRRTRVALMRGRFAGRDALVGELPDQALPVGVSDAVKPAAEERGAWGAAWERSELGLHVRGRVVAPGNATLGFGFEPLENPEGRFMREQPLAIDAPLYAPYRARENISSEYLRPLSDPGGAFALVVYADSEEAVAHAGRAFEALLGLVPAPDRYCISVPAAAHEPDELSEVSGKRFLGSRHWKKLIEQMRSEPRIRIETKGSLSPRHGMAFGIGDGQPRSADELLPALCLWTSLDDRQDREAVLPALRSAIDQVLSAGQGVQAALALWNETPEGVGSTPYEDAVGIGHCTTCAAWAKRWLRAVGNVATWLGPELRARLDDEAALAGVAQVTELGPALRLDVGEPAEVPRLEARLADLLPTPADCERFRAGA